VDGFPLLVAQTSKQAGLCYAHTYGQQEWISAVAVGPQAEHQSWGLAYWVKAVNRRPKCMRYLSAVCFLAIVAFADASPQQQTELYCFCRVKAKGGGGFG